MTTGGGHSNPARPGPSLADLSPAYFGLVMATGIVSLAASMMEHPSLALALFHLNVGQFAVLSLLYGLRAWRYPRRFFGDMCAHLTGPGYFTMVAGTGILASQFLVLDENVIPELIQWDCTPEKLADALLPLLSDTPVRQRQLEAFSKLDALMKIGDEVPSERAARIVEEVLSSKECA